MTPTGSPDALRIVVVGGDPMLSESLRIALPLASGDRLRVVGVAATLPEALAMFDEHAPEVLSSI